MHGQNDPLNSVEAIAYALYERRISPETAITWLRALVGDDALTWPEHLAGWVVGDLDDCEALVVSGVDDMDNPTLYRQIEEGSR